MTTNVVQRVIFDVEVPGKNEANRFEKHFKPKILQALKTQIDRFSNEYIDVGEHVMAEKILIELDLGNPDIDGQIFSQLYKQLPHFNKQGKLVAHQGIQSESKDQGALVHYLTKGYLPWWISKQKLFDFDQMLKDFLGHQNAQHLINQFFQNEVARKRLIGILSPGFAYRFLELAGFSNASVLLELFESAVGIARSKNLKADSAILLRQYLLLLTEPGFNRRSLENMEILRLFLINELALINNISLRRIVMIFPYTWFGNASSVFSLIIGQNTGRGIGSRISKDNAPAYVAKINDTLSDFFSLSVLNIWNQIAHQSNAVFYRHKIIETFYSPGFSEYYLQIKALFMQSGLIRWSTDIEKAMLEALYLVYNQSPNNDIDYQKLNSIFMLQLSGHANVKSEMLALHFLGYQNKYSLLKKIDLVNSVSFGLSTGADGEKTDDTAPSFEISVQRDVYKQMFEMMSRFQQAFIFTDLPPLVRALMIYFPVDITPNQYEGKTTKEIEESYYRLFEKNYFLPGNTIGFKYLIGELLEHSWLQELFYQLPQKLQIRFLNRIFANKGLTMDQIAAEPAKYMAFLLQKLFPAIQNETANFSEVVIKAFEKFKDEPLFLENQRMKKRAGKQSRLLQVPRLREDLIFILNNNLPLYDEWFSASFWDESNKTVFAEVLKDAEVNEAICELDASSITYIGLELLATSITGKGLQTKKALKTSASNDDNTLFNAFLFFLKKGFLPFWYAEQPIAYWYSTLTDLFRDGLMPVGSLQVALQNPAARIRLYTSFDALLIGRVLMKATGPHAHERLKNSIHLVDWIKQKVPEIDVSFLHMAVFEPFLFSFFKKIDTTWSDLLNQVIALISDSEIAVNIPANVWSDLDQSLASYKHEHTVYSEHFFEKSGLFNAIDQWLDVNLPQEGKRLSRAMLELFDSERFHVHFYSELINWLHEQTVTSGHMDQVQFFETLKATLAEYRLGHLVKEIDAIKFPVKNPVLFNTFPFYELDSLSQLLVEEINSTFPVSGTLIVHLLKNQLSKGVIHYLRFVSILIDYENLSTEQISKKTKHLLGIVKLPENKSEQEILGWWINFAAQLQLFIDLTFEKDVIGQVKEFLLQTSFSLISTSVPVQSMKAIFSGLIETLGKSIIDKNEYYLQAIGIIQQNDLELIMEPLVSWYKSAESKSDGVIQSLPDDFQKISELQALSIFLMYCVDTGELKLQPNKEMAFQRIKSISYYLLEPKHVAELFSIMTVSEQKNAFQMIKSVFGSWAAFIIDALRVQSEQGDITNELKSQVAVLPKTSRAAVLNEMLAELRQLLQTLGLDKQVVVQPETASVQELAGMLSTEILKLDESSLEHLLTAMRQSENIPIRQLAEKLEGVFSQQLKKEAQKGSRYKNLLRQSVFDALAGLVAEAEKLQQPQPDIPPKTVQAAVFNEMLAELRQLLQTLGLDKQVVVQPETASVQELAGMLSTEILKLDESSLERLLTALRHSENIPIRHLAIIIEDSILKPKADQEKLMASLKLQLLLNVLSFLFTELLTIFSVKRKPIIKFISSPAYMKLVNDALLHPTLKLEVEYILKEMQKKFDLDLSYQQLALHFQHYPGKQPLLESYITYGQQQRSNNEIEENLVAITEQLGSRFESPSYASSEKNMSIPYSTKDDGDEILANYQLVRHLTAQNDGASRFRAFSPEDVTHLLLIELDHFQIIVPSVIKAIPIIEGFARSASGLLMAQFFNELFGLIEQLLPKWLSSIEKINKKEGLQISSEFPLLSFLANHQWFQLTLPKGDQLLTYERRLQEQLGTLILKPVKAYRYFLFLEQVIERNKALNIRLPDIDIAYELSHLKQLATTRHDAFFVEILRSFVVYGKPVEVSEILVSMTDQLTQGFKELLYNELLFPAFNQTISRHTLVQSRIIGQRGQQEVISFLLQFAALKTKSKHIAFIENILKRVHYKPIDQLAVAARSFSSGLNVELDVVLDDFIEVARAGSYLYVQELIEKLKLDLLKPSLSEEVKKMKVSTKLELFDMESVSSPSDLLNELIKQKHNWTDEVKEGEKIYINNAGLIIFWPFIEKLFVNLGYCAEKKFIDFSKQERGVYLLQYLATGNEEYGEHLMALNKLICGLKISEPLITRPVLSEDEKTECDELIKAVISHWKIISTSSPEAIRQSFILREGILYLKKRDWNLKVEMKAVDRLLSKIPWGFSTIKMPWNKFLILTEWI